MIIRANFKCPETEQALREEYLNEDDLENNPDKFYEDERIIQRFLDRYTKYGEVVTIEYDSENDTCKVVGRKNERFD